MGASLNVVNSQWASRESTIGPGSDSYYEYLLKVGAGALREGGEGWSLTNDGAAKGKGGGVDVAVCLRL